MENIKTGTLIKKMRTEKKLTQKQLAERLHITDRAVSKWERGLCAPDISLLEPLAKALDISIVELLGCESALDDGHNEKAAQGALNLLGYAKNEIEYKTRSIKRKYLLITMICAAAAWLLSCVMCINITSAVVNVAWITFHGGNEVNITKTFAVLYTGIPYLLGMSIAVIIAVIFRKKSKEVT